MRRMQFLGRVIFKIILAAMVLSVGITPQVGFSTSTTSPFAPWPMFRHDLFHTGQSPFLGAQTYHSKWNFSIGQGPGIGSNPAIDIAGTVYFNGGGYLYALYPDGTLNWRYFTGDSIALSSPAIDQNGAIYVGSSDGNLYSIRPDGTLRWKFATTGGIESSPMIGADGTIYVGSNDNNLYAITQIGDLKWKFTTSGPVRSSVAIDSGGTIYFGSSDSKLYAISSRGTLRWSFKTGGEVWSSAAIGQGEGRIYFTSKDCTLYALSLGGNLKWKFRLAPSISGYPPCFNEVSSPAIGRDGTIYIGDGQAGFGVWAINRDGTLSWEYGAAEIGSSPAIGSDGTIYIGVDDPPSLDPFFTVGALNHDGSFKWGCGFCLFDFSSSPSIAPDGTIYIGTGNILRAIS